MSNFPSCFRSRRAKLSEISLAAALWLSPAKQKMYIYVQNCINYVITFCLTFSTVQPLTEKLLYLPLTVTHCTECTTLYESESGLGFGPGQNGTDLN